MYLNEVTLIGNLTRDPEIKALPSGNVVGTFSLATNRTWKDSNGAKQEAVEYHNVIAFGKTAELIDQYVKKGDSILIKGRLQTRSWEGQDGKKQYRTEIVTESMQFGNKTKAETTQPAESERRPAPLDDAPSVKVPLSDDDINPEDIPF